MTHDRARFYFSLLTAAATFVLICAGALVTSTGSGLSVPDWPLSYGTLFPPMVGGVRFEHTHRLIAGSVAILTLVLAIWTSRCEKRRGVRLLAWAALAAVLAQAILGGLTVLLLLPTAVSVAHAGLAMAFFCATVLLAYLQGGGRLAWSRGSALAALTTLAIYVQILIGAWMRHSGTGLAIPDFPFSYGGWIPPLASFPVRLAFAHRVGALVVLALVSATAAASWARRRENPSAARFGLLLLGLTVIQALLGAFTIWTMKSVWVVSAHVAAGALLLATSALETSTFETASQRPTSPARTPGGVRALAGRPRPYVELVKPRLTLLSVFTTAAGFWLAEDALSFSWRIVWTLAGAALCAGGASALNQVLEVKQDALMERTRKRPIPTGRVSERSAQRFGVALCLAGLALLAGLVNLAASGLAALSIATYLGVYTPLKTRTTLCTLAGAIPGAIPPLIGWAAARGSLDLGAWILFAVLFFWQLPHFLAIARLYRDDYRRAGFRMLGLEDGESSQAGRQIVLYALALLAVTLLPVWRGEVGAFYVAGAAVLGAAFLALGVIAAVKQTPLAARRLFLGSLAYLPLMMLLMVAGRVG